MSITEATTVKQTAENWRSFLPFVTSFRRSTILFSALELNIFDHIGEQGASINEIAASVSLEKKSCEQLLNALVANKYLIFFEGKYYHNESEQNEYLKSSASYNYHNDLLLHKHENEVWMNLAKIAKREFKVPKSYSNELLDNNIIKYRGILNSNLSAAGNCLGTVSKCISSQKRVLDIGGGDGIHGKVLMSINPEMDLSILDLPNCFEGCEKHLSSEIAKNQVKLIPGDALDLKMDEKFDLITLNELLEIFSRDEKMKILKSSRKLSSKIVITKFALDESGTNPGGSSIFSLRMSVKYPNSYLSADVEISEMLKEAGYEDIFVLSVPRSSKTVIIAGFDTPLLTPRIEVKEFVDKLGIDKPMLASWRNHIQDACQFRLSCIVQCAIELNIFEVFKSQISVDFDELNSRLKVDSLMLKLLLNCLVALKLLKKDGQTYFANETLLSVLFDEEKTTLLDELRIYGIENQNWLRMTEKLKGTISRTVSFEDDMKQTNTTDAYIRSIELANKGFVPKYLDTLRPVFEKAATVLDIGGGHGLHARSICDEFQHTKVSILDLPSMIPMTEKYCQSYIAHGAINPISGDATSFNLGSAFDVVIINDLLHYFSADEVLQIIANAKKHLEQGGFLVLSEFMLDYGLNAVNHIFSLKAHLKSKNGGVHSLNNLRSYLHKLGMEPIKLDQYDKKLILVAQVTS